MLVDSPRPSQDIIARSLASAEGFGRTVVPLVEAAWPHAVDLVRRVPERGLPDEEAQLQALPTLLRLGVHQLVAGHNSRVPKEDRLARTHKRNLALCFSQRDFEMRVLKRSRRYPTKPSGPWQERLIDQATWRSYAEGGQLALGDWAEEPLLNPVMYWISSGFELVGVKIVLPFGFLDEGGLVILAEAALPLDAGLAEYGTFVAVDAGPGLLLAAGGEPLPDDLVSSTDAEEAGEREGYGSLFETADEYDERGEE